MVNTSYPDSMGREPGESATEWRDRLVEDRRQLLDMLQSVNSERGARALDRHLGDFARAIAAAEAEAE